MNCKCTSTVVYVDTTHLLYGIFHVLICTYIHSQLTGPNITNQSSGKSAMMAACIYRRMKSTSGTLNLESGIKSVEHDAIHHPATLHHLRIVVFSILNLL